MAGSIRAAWVGLPPPPSGARARAVRIRGKNAWVTKSSTGGFGLVLTGVERPQRDSLFKNLRIRYLGDLEFDEVGSGPRIVSRCLEVTLEPPYDTETIAAIMDRLHDKNPAGDFSTASLLGILDDVRTILESQPPGPSKEEAVGAWGELVILETLVRRAKDPASQSRLLRSWESRREGRDILDFRFKEAEVVMEAKTTLGRRIHHFQSYGQVTTPSGYREGYLSSVSLEEPHSRGGRSCADLVRSIRESFLGGEDAKKTLNAQLDLKIETRGNECTDSRFTFDLAGDGLVLYPFAAVPRPSGVPLVSDVEWTADLTTTQPVARKDSEAILDTLSS